MDCNHLQDVRAKVVREITGLTEQQLNAKQRHDVWSIGQICHHLILSEGAFADAIEQGLKKTIKSQWYVRSRSNVPGSFCENGCSQKHSTKRRSVSS